MIRLIYFTATWCGPCRTFGPLLARQGLPIERVDIDHDPEGVASAYGVLSVPTVVVLDGEAVIDRFGALGPAALQARLSSAHGTSTV